MNLANRSAAQHRKPYERSPGSAPSGVSRMHRGPLYGLLILVAFGALEIVVAFWVARHFF